MNIFGKNLDDNAVNKLLELLNSPEGQELKNKFANVDKAALMEQIKKTDFGNLNEKSLSDFLNNSDNYNLLEKLKNINLNDLKR